MRALDLSMFFFYYYYFRGNSFFRGVPQSFGVTTGKKLQVAFEIAPPTLFTDV